MPTPQTSPASWNPHEDQLTRIAEAYEHGQYLRAYQQASALSPLESWRGAEARILAGKLAAVLGASRLGSLLHFRAWREHPDSPQAFYYYSYGLFNRRGAFAALTFLDRHASRAGGDSHSADLPALQAMIWAHLRDFSTADTFLNRALETAPQDPWIRVAHSHVREREDRYEAALEALEPALAQNTWYRPAIQQRAHLLQLLGQDQQALELLREADRHIESEGVVRQLLAIQMELRLYPDALNSLDRIEVLSPLKDRQFKGWLAGWRADLLYYLGERAGAIRHCREANNGFHRQVAENLQQANTDALPVRLNVTFVRQHHLTCGPATLSALSSYFGQPIDHSRIVASIWYSGTFDHDERQWAIENAWFVKEFTVTWEAAVQLLDHNIPFALTTVEPRGGHLQAVIGYDPCRGTLLIRDPYYPHCQEVLGQVFLQIYRSTGPRGMAMVPAAEAGRLHALKLPEEDLYERWFQVQTALKNHQRRTAAKVAAEMNRAHPDHRISIQAQRALAIYDNNETEIAVATDRLLRLFPNDACLQLSKQYCLHRLGRKPDRFAFLEKLCRQDAVHPLLRIEYCDMLAEDARRYPLASRVVTDVLRRQPLLAAAYSCLAGMLWNQRKFEEAFQLYRIAASLEDKDERYVRSYFLAARHLKREKNALTWLEERCDRLMEKSGQPAMTLYDAYDRLDRSQDGLKLIAAALKRRPHDGDLQLFAATVFARHGRHVIADKLLRRAQNHVQPGCWLAAAADLEHQRGELEKSLNLWKKVARIDPMDIRAHRAVATLLAKTKSRRTALTYIKSLHKRFPHRPDVYFLWLQWLVDEPLPVQEAVLTRWQGVDRHNAWICRELAVNLIRQSRPAEAAKQLDRAKQLDPNSPRLYEIYGDWAQAAGHPELAPKAFRQAIQLSADSVYACRQLLACAGSNDERRRHLDFIKSQLLEQECQGEGWLAFCALAKSILDAAELLATLQQAWKARPDVWHTWSALTMQLRDMGRIDEARKIAAQSVARFPLIPRMCLDLASCFRLLGDLEAEKCALRQALAINPNWGSAIQQLADSYERAGRYQESARLLRQALQRDPLDPALHGFLAHALWRLSRRQQALEYIRRAIELDPDYEWAWNQLKEWSHALQKPELPVQIARKLTEKLSGEARSWLVLARMLDDRRLAMQAVNKAIVLEPRNVAAHELKIQKLIALKEYGKARLAVDFAGWSGQIPLSLRNYIPWITRSEGKLGPAISKMQDLLHQEPYFAEGWHLLAAWCREAERFDEALTASRRFAELEPNNELAQAVLADALLRAGDREAAIDHFQRALALAPGYMYAGLSLFDLHLEDDHLDQAEQLLAGLEPHGEQPDIPYLTLRRIQLAAGRRDRPTAVSQLANLCRLPDAEAGTLDAGAKAVSDAGWDADLDRLLDKFVFQPQGAHPYVGVLYAARQQRKIWELSDGDVKRFLGSGQLGHAVVEEYLKYLSSADGWNRIKNLVSAYESDFRTNTDLWGIVGWILLRCKRYKDVITWMSDWESRPDVFPWALYNLTVALRQTGRWQEALAVGKRALSEPADHTVHEHRVWTALELVLQGDASAFETLLPLIDPQEMGGYDLFAYYLLSALQSLQGRHGYLKALGRAAHAKLKQAAGSLPAYRRHRQLELLYRRVVIAISKQLARFPMSLWWRVRLHYIGVR